MTAGSKIVNGVSYVHGSVALSIIIGIQSQNFRHKGMSPFKMVNDEQKYLTIIRYYVKYWIMIAQTSLEAHAYILRYLT